MGTVVIATVVVDGGVPCIVYTFIPPGSAGTGAVGQTLVSTAGVTVRQFSAMKAVGVVSPASTGVGLRC